MTPASNWPDGAETAIVAESVANAYGISVETTRKQYADEIAYLRDRAPLESTLSELHDQIRKNFRGNQLEEPVYRLICQLFSDADVVK